MIELRQMSSAKSTKEYGMSQNRAKAEVSNAKQVSKLNFAFALSSFYFPTLTF
jgi:hypothetical protein